MPATHPDLASIDLWERSLARSRARRRALQRRRPMAARGAAVSLAVAGVAVAAPAGGAAVAQARSSSGTLSTGSRGAAVAAVQRALGVSADGVFGSRTRGAVRRFQARHHLSVDGVVGPQTARALGVSLGGAGRSSHRAVHHSTRHHVRTFSAPWVAAVQRKLGISADGVFGPQTERAVRAFQARHGLAVDGVVGPRTRAALGIGGSSTNKGSSHHYTHNSSLLQRIAQCESGGNPRAVSSGGRYRGKYQFTRGTWASLGGHGDPAAAPESVQDRLAAKLMARTGPSAWPYCSRHV